MFKKTSFLIQRRFNVTIFLLENIAKGCSFVRKVPRKVFAEGSAEDFRGRFLRKVPWKVSRRFSVEGSKSSL